MFLYKGKEFTSMKKLVQHLIDTGVVQAVDMVMLKCIKAQKSYQQYVQYVHELQVKHKQTHYVYGEALYNTEFVKHWVWALDRDLVLRT